MQISLTATGGLERRLEVAVPKERVHTEVEQRLKTLSRTAKLKGFRPGKVPFPVVRQQFGEQVHAEVVGELMRATFSEAVNQEKLKPATGPRIEPIAVAPGTDLKYAAVFEVLPDIAIKSPAAISIERPVTSVTEDDIDAMIESMRRQRPVFSEVEREARDSDRATVEFTGRLDGVEFPGGQGKDIPFVIGQGRLLPDFEKGVVGMKPGESREIPVAFPADYASKDLAGKTAQFTITLSKLEEQSLPPVDDEFATAFGVNEGGVAKLREEVRASMEREVSDAIRTRVRTQVLDALYREHSLEVPKSLVDEQIQELQVDMLRRMGAKEVKELPPREPFEEPARRRVALGLLLGEIVRTQGLKIDRARVQARLSDVVAAYPNADEMRRAYLQNADAMRQIESAVLEDQAVDWVVGAAKVEEKPVSFKELTGFGQNQQG